MASGPRPHPAPRHNPSGEECIRVLERLGYHVADRYTSPARRIEELRLRFGVREDGHARLHCAGRSPVTVPLHDELDPATLRAILAVAGIGLDRFRSLQG